MSYYKLLMKAMAMRETGLNGTLENELLTASKEL